MRQICYSVAISLDGYIAGSGGEFDWIPMDPDIDFAALAAQFDTYLVGRRTFEVTRGPGPAAMPGVRTFVFSRTLRQSDYDDVTIVGDTWKEVVQALRAEGGQGHLAVRRRLAVSQPRRGGVGRHGGGRHHPHRARRRYSTGRRAGRAHCIALTLQEHTVYQKTGTVFLVYAVNDAVQA